MVIYYLWDTSTRRSHSAQITSPRVVSKSCLTHRFLSPLLHEQIQIHRRVRYSILEKTCSCNGIKLNYQATNRLPTTMSRARKTKKIIKIRGKKARHYSLTFPHELYVFLFQLSWNLKDERVDHGIHFVADHCKCFAALGWEVHLNEDCGNIVANFLPTDWWNILSFSSVVHRFQALPESFRVWIVCSFF